MVAGGESVAGPRITPISTDLKVKGNRQYFRAEHFMAFGLYIIHTPVVTCCCKEQQSSDSWMGLVPHPWWSRHVLTPWQASIYTWIQECSISVLRCEMRCAETSPFFGWVRSINKLKESQTCSLRLWLSNHSQLWRQGIPDSLQSSDNVYPSLSGSTETEVIPQLFCARCWS